MQAHRESQTAYPNVDYSPLGTSPDHLNESRTYPAEYLIPEHNFSYLAGHIDRLNRKADQFGGSRIVCTVTGFEDIPDRYSSELMGHKVLSYKRCLYVTLSGKAPSLKGWTFVAKLTRSESGTSNIVRVMPEETLPETYRHREITCDYCGKPWLRRTTAYVLRNDATGEFKEVGSSCLKDFIGHPDPERYAQIAVHIDALRARIASEDFQQPMDHDDTFIIADFLCAAATVVRVLGWVSRAKADELGVNTTGDDAWSFFTRTSDTSWRDFIPTDEDQQTADSLLAWARATLPNMEQSDYVHNLSSLLSSDYAHVNDRRMVASLFGMKMRYDRDRAVQQEHKAEAEASSYQGAVGKRMALSLTVTKVITITVSGYGYHATENAYIYLMKDAHGNVFTWKTRNECMGEGEPVVLKGTVKGHSEYRGVAQTELTRCKVVETDREEMK